jgi:predicted Zn finger-like uncharacterized protein
MYTCCPLCQTVYRLSAHQLSMAHGHVRCGRCGEVYDAVDYIADELDDDGELPANFHTDRPPTLSHTEFEDDILEHDLFVAREASEIAPPESMDLMDLAPPDDEELEMLKPVSGHTWSWMWSFGCVILIALLFGQYGWARQAAWAQDEMMRPWFDQTCKLLGCTVPMRRDLGQIRLVNRDIRPHPSVADALIISATMQNRAPFPQPFPTVEIQLSDLNGRLIAMRRFPPGEYLQDDAAGSSDRERGLAPGTLLPMVFEVVDPGQNAVAFEFTFR